MRIIRKDVKHGFIQTAVSNLDDLWVLYNVIEKNDVVYGRTTREVKQDFTARPSSKRVGVILAVRVQKTYYDRGLNRLRVHGIVADAPEDLNVRGSHHTLNVGVDDSITIVKDPWRSHQVERIERAVKKETPFGLVGIDSDEAAVALVRSYTVDVKNEIFSRLPGKGRTERDVAQREESMKAYLSKVVKAANEIVGETRGIVIVGPGFLKDNLAKYIRSNNPGLGSKIVAVKGVSAGGAAGIHEATRSGILSKVLRDARALQEIELVEEALRRLGASKGDISYGLERVGEDAEAGAVEKVLVCDEELREASDERRAVIEGLLRSVEQKSGEVSIISSEHEGGKKLSSLGGVAALLRYQRHH